MDSSSQAENQSKIRKGRRKVKMEKMENQNNLQVTFSKRRYGLFKKASELCTLTGSQIGIIVFSPAKRVFSFGHPSVQKMIDDHFPTEGEEGGMGTRNSIALTPHLQQHMMCNEKLVEAQRAAYMTEHNAKLHSVEMQIQAEKLRTTTITEREKEEMDSHKPIKDMTEAELLEMRACLSALKDKVMRMESTQY